jgi:hypothetical protein
MNLRQIRLLAAGDPVQRREAIQFLTEIGSHPEVIPFTCVFLKPHRTDDRDSENLELHVKTNRDASTRRVIERLAQKHQFQIREETDGFLVIYTPGRKILEITA